MRILMMAATSLLIVAGVQSSPRQLVNEPYKGAQQECQKTGISSPKPLTAVSQPQSYSKTDRKDNDAHDSKEDSVGHKPPGPYDQFWSNWALVIVGFGAILVALPTLWAIKHQADALMNAERAWILVTDIVNPVGLYLPDSPLYIPGIVYKMKVAGRTPARIINQGFRFHAVPKKPGRVPPEPDLPSTPDYTSQTQNPEIPEGGRVIPSEIVFTIGHYLESIQLSSEEFEELKRGDKIMCAYGFIEYRDAFDRPGKTQFSYVYDFRWGGVRTSPEGTVLNPPGFRLGGPAEYNKAT